jgi:hypothetical protein
MAEASHGPGFLKKSLQGNRVFLEVYIQHLDGNLAQKLPVLR